MIELKVTPKKEGILDLWWHGGHERRGLLARSRSARKALVTRLRARGGFQEPTGRRQPRLRGSPLPMKGKIEFLNASVAAGIRFYATYAEVR